MERRQEAAAVDGDLQGLSVTASLPSSILTSLPRCLTITYASVDKGLAPCAYTTCSTRSVSGRTWQPQRLGEGHACSTAVPRRPAAAARAALPWLGTRRPSKACRPPPLHQREGMHGQQARRRMRSASCGAAGRPGAVSLKRSGRMRLAPG